MPITHACATAARTWSARLRSTRSARWPRDPRRPRHPPPSAVGLRVERRLLPQLDRRQLAALYPPVLAAPLSDGGRGHDRVRDRDGAGDRPPSPPLADPAGDDGDGDHVHDPESVALLPAA